MEALFSINSHHGMEMMTVQRMLSLLQQRNFLVGLEDEEVNLSCANLNEGCTWGTTSCKKECCGKSMKCWAILDGFRGVCIMKKYDKEVLND